MILLDIEMPVMDGYAFARAYGLRAHRAPIIVVTAVVDHRQAAERVGAVASIAKPFELDQVLAAVRRHRLVE